MRWTSVCCYALWRAFTPEIGYREKEHPTEGRRGGPSSQEVTGSGARLPVTILPKGYLQGSQDIPVRTCWASGPGAQMGRLQWGRTAAESPSRLDLAKPSPKGVVGALEAPRTPTPLQERLLSPAHPPRPRPAHARRGLLPSRSAAKTERAQPGAGCALRGRVKGVAT